MARAWLVISLAGTLSSGCGISDLVGDLKDLQDQYEAPDAGAQPNEQDSDAGPSQNLDVQATARILDEQGGQLATAAGGIDVPAGALTEAAEIEVAHVAADKIVAKLPSVLHAVAPAVAFTPHGQTFTKPVTLSLFHEGQTQNLVVLRLDDETDTNWERVDATFAAGVAFVTSTHFSIYNVSECDPSANPEGRCAGLVQGELEVADLAAGEFSDFTAPHDFGAPSTDGSGQPVSDPSEGEECTFETVCQVIGSCRPRSAEPDTDQPLAPSPDGGASCEQVQEEICWEECVTGGDDILPTGPCKMLPQQFDEGCAVVPSDGPCPIEVRCGGSTLVPDGGLARAPSP